MDLVSQIQTYVRSIGASLAYTSEFLESQAPSVSADYERISSDAIEEKADQLMQLFTDVDVLMASLPSHFSSEEEQLEELDRLSKENAKAGTELERVKEEAKKYQTKLGQVIEYVALHQFETHKEEEEDNMTQQKE